MALDPDVALRGFQVAWTVLAGGVGVMLGGAWGVDSPTDAVDALSDSNSELGEHS